MVNIDKHYLTVYEKGLKPNDKPKAIAKIKNNERYSRNDFKEIYSTISSQKSFQFKKDTVTLPSDYVMVGYNKQEKKPFFIHGVNTVPMYSENTKGLKVAK